MKETLNYNLKKPDHDDYYNVDDFNYNADIIDKTLKQNETDISLLNNELENSENTKYRTTNGIKEFESKNGYACNFKFEGETLVNRYRGDLGTDYDEYVQTPAKDYRSLTNAMTVFNVTDKKIQVQYYNKITDKWMANIDIGPYQNMYFDLPALNAYMYSVIGYKAEGWTTHTELKTSVVWVEGDLTGRKLSYFEGLKSVSQGDKIEVLTHDSSVPINLTSVRWKDGYYLANDTHFFDGGERVEPNYSYTETYIEIEPSTNYIAINANWNFCFYDKNKRYIPSICTKPILEGDIISTGTFSKMSPDNAKYVRLTTQTVLKSSIQLFKSTYDKKQILTTLRSLPNGVKDIIHEVGGKYYKLKKCEEFMLNDTNDWGSFFANNDNIKTNAIGVRLPNILEEHSSDIFCDKYTPKLDRKFKDQELCYIFPSDKGFRFYVQFNKERYADKNAFLNDIKNNPITVVLPLKEPILEEMPNFEPIIYNETTLSINSGVLQGETEFEITNNLRNEIDVIKNKVSDLDNNIDNGFKIIKPIILNGLQMSGNQCCKIIKQGKIGTLVAQLLSPSALDTNTIILKVPLPLKDGWYPSNITLENYNKENIPVWLYSDGTIRVFAEIPINSIMNINIPLYFK